MMAAGELVQFMILPKIVGLGAVDLAIEASRVDRVTDAVDWRGDATVDIAGALGVSWRDGAPQRVLVLKRDGRAVGVAVTGKLEVRAVDRRLLQPLPPELGADRALAGIVFSDGDAAVLALDCEELAA